MAATGGRIGRGVTAVVVGLCLLVPALQRPAPAGASTSFEAVAAADGIRFSFQVPDAPVTDTPLDGGGPSAQAVFNTSGVSRAFAAHPYPGEAVVTGPGTVAGFTGGQITPPAYPFAVASDHPTVPEQSNDQGAYRVKASSADQQSDAEAHVGSSAGPEVTAGARAAAQARGGAVAEGVSDVTGFAVGDVRIGRVLSTAQVTSAPDGTLTRSSDLAVNGVTVNGTAVSLGPAGLTYPGGSVPLPDADPVRQALAAAGVTITYLKPVSHPTGVIAPGVAVSAPVTLPSGGRATAVYRLGQSSASIGAVSIPGAGDISPAPGGVDPGTGSGEPVDAGTGASSGGVPSTEPTGAGSGVANGSYGIGSPGVGAATGAAGGAVSGSGSADTGALAGPAGPSGSAAPGGGGSEVLAAPVLRARGFDSASIFLVLAAAGLVAFGLVTLFSALGVRRR